MSEEKKEVAAPENASKPEDTAKLEAAPKKKKRWKRILVRVGIGLALLLLVAILARDLIIRTTVIKVGTAVTGTRVEMDSFSTSFGGTVNLGGFRVANPEGYHSPYAFQVAKIKVSVDVGSLFTDKIEVKEILISGTEIDYELKIDGSSNLTDIKKNIDAFAGAPKAKPEPEPEKTEEQKKAEEAQAEEAKKSAKKVVLRVVSLDNSSLSISSSLLNTKVPMPLPPLTLNDIGDGKSLGETLSDLSTEILAALSTAISKSGIKNVGDALGNAGQAVGDSLKQGTDALTDAGKNLGDSLNDAGKNITDLFSK